MSNRRFMTKVASDGDENETTISVNNDHVELNPQKKLVTNCRGVCHIIMAWAGAGVGWGRDVYFHVGADLGARSRAGALSTAV